MAGASSGDPGSQIILRWLNKSKALLAFAGDNRTTVVDSIVTFADERSRYTLNPDKDSILSEYERLEKRIQQCAPL